MTYNDATVDLIDQRIRSHDRSLNSTGTLTAAPNPVVAYCIFDGSSVASPVKVPAGVRTFPGDRVLLTKYGSDWIVTETFTDWAPTVYLTANQVLSASSTTLQNITGFTFTCNAATSTWKVVAFVNFTASTTEDLKFGWNATPTTGGTASVTATWGRAGALNNAATGSAGTAEAWGYANDALPTGFVAPVGGAGSPITNIMPGVFFLASPAIVALQAAQNTSAVTTPTINKGSYMELTRLA